MSAFYIGYDHVDALLSIARAIRVHEVDDANTEQLTTLGRAMLEENCLSLAARYPNDWQELISQSPETYEFHAIKVAFTPDTKLAADLVRLTECYSYQSCEHDSWDSSLSAEFVVSCQARAGRILAKAIPETFSCWPFLA